MGFAIQDCRAEVFAENGPRHQNWHAYTDSGNTYQVDQVNAYSLSAIKAGIRDYHLKKHSGYGERIAKRRLDYLRGEIQAERISYGEISELESLADYIDDDDVELLRWANVPESERQ